MLTFKLNINMVKTKVMVCGKQNEPDVNISLEGDRIERVNRLKYYGSVISNAGRSKKGIKRSNKAGKKCIATQ